MTAITREPPVAATAEGADPENRKPVPTRSLTAALRRRVLLVFQTHREEAVAMLHGIARYGHSHVNRWAMTVDEEARAASDPKWLLDHAWDGVISRHSTPELVQACVEHGIPLIDLDDTPQFVGVPKIHSDNAAIGRLGADYLSDLGFVNLGFCGFGAFGWARERRAGFVDALRRRNHDCQVFEEHRVRPAALPGGPPPDPAPSLLSWLLGLPKPAAVMACNDARASEVLDAAASAGLLVPEEIAVLGANNDSFHCELTFPPLSSVATNLHQIGFRAAELLAGLMAGDVPAAGVESIAPLHVVSRRSTDVLAIPDPHVVAALRYIGLHACDPMNVDQVLPLARVSRSQLEKKFRQYLGRSPQAEIRRVQVTRIRQLLAETDFPLKKIAELAGFDYQEYMCVAFRRLTGETPGAYRKRMRPYRSNDA